MKPIIELLKRNWTIEEIALIYDVPPQFVIGVAKAWRLKCK